MTWSDNCLDSRADEARLRSSSHPPEALVELTIGGNFGEQVLSLSRRPDGYLLELRFFAVDVFAFPIKSEQRGPARQRALDRATAELFLKLWQVLLARAQIPERTEFDIHGRPRTFTMMHEDGQTFDVWQPSGFATTWSPRSGSVSELAVTAAQRLASSLDSSPEAGRKTLRESRALMRKALARALANEPCWILDAPR